MESGSTLAKSKTDRATQRERFVALSEAGLEVLRGSMHSFARCEEEEVMDVNDVPKNARARAWHLADDPLSVGYLDLIFGGVKKSARRAEVDDKSTRAINQWQHLADEFYNRAGWAPENEFVDSRLSDIDPSKPPPEPYSAEQLRKLFSSMRTAYSVFNDRYHRSGQLEEGDGDGDDDFFENFSGRDVVYLYAHKLFKAQPPRFCLRDLNDKCDVGLSGSSTSGSVSSLDSCGKKRKHVDLTREDYKEIFAPTQDEMDRDRSIAEYYSVTKNEATMRILESTMSGAAFASLSEEVRLQMQAKYEATVQKFIESLNW